MTSAWVVLGFLLLALGFIGCLVPVLPGPVVAYAALWTLTLADPALPGARLLTLATLVLVAVEILDYTLPAVVAAKFRCGRAGTFGCLVGTLAGLFFAPWGLLLGPFLGAALGELAAGRQLASALRGGFGALVGFVLTLVLKFAACGLFAYWFWTRLPR